jgi:cell division protein FtsI (penicillin-binding protein 3)
MVNQPAYNPNDRDQINARSYRNRAATDIFEPGSSIKPFIVAAALASGRYRADSIVDTTPGSLRVGIKTITDEHPIGIADLSTVIAKSSNVARRLLPVPFGGRSPSATSGCGNRRGCR